MHENVISFVGKRIKELRLGRDLKLVEVAIKSSISKGLLSRVENVRTTPSLPVLFNIINALDEIQPLFLEQLDFRPNSPFCMLIKKNGIFFNLKRILKVFYNYI
jgi:Predicted transcriptional regulators